MEFQPERRGWVLLLGIGFEGGLALAAWPLGWLLHQPPLENFHWSASDCALGMAAALPMLAVFLGLIHWPLAPVARLRSFLEETLVAFFGAASLVELALLSLTAGVGEELLFRSVLQAKLAHWLGAEAGLVIASLLFGLMHPISWTYFVLAAGFGVYLGWLWTATGSLLLVIVAHALYDFVALAYLLRRPRRADLDSVIQESAPS